MLSQGRDRIRRTASGIETPTPLPTGTEVLLKVHNAGVCHSDVHIHDGYFDLGGGNKLPMANIKLRTRSAMRSKAKLLPSVPT
ncbi:MAG: alcohol dehydrogenase catalytic domain-containing protein [Rhizomicrobium sp.]